VTGNSASANGQPSLAKTWRRTAATRSIALEESGNPNAQAATTGMSWLDKIHLGLNAASIALDASVVGSVFAWIPDVIDAYVSLGEGDFVGAGMSVLGAIPELGAAANAAKMARIARKVERGAQAAEGAKVLRKAPAPNGGVAKPHGGAKHDSAIDKHVEELGRDPSATNVRKNQVQTDVNGNRVGDNRPDLQYDRCGVHYCVEYDTIENNSVRHGEVIRANDPNAEVDLNVLK
jgi:hypothetical protein